MIFNIIDSRFLSSNTQDFIEVRPRLPTLTPSRHIPEL